MTPSYYAATIAVPTLREFLADRGSQRRAFLACVAVYHVIDHLAQARLPLGLSRSAAETLRGKEADKIRGELRTICAPALAVVKEMCNGTKHGDPVVAREVPAFGYGMPGAGWGQGRWGTPGIQVEYGGDRMFVDHCAQAVMLTLRGLHVMALDPLDLSFFDPSFRGKLGWQQPPTQGIVPKP